MQPVVHHDLAAADNLGDLARRQALTFEQNHLATAAKSRACALPVAAPQGRNLGGAQLNLLNLPYAAAWGRVN